MTVVEDGVKVTNIDNSELNRLKRSENALDCGAERVLEALELFIDDLEAKHYYEKRIPYENMFNALKCVISSSKENQNIRNAIMTGIIEEATGTVKKEPVKQVVKEKKVALDTAEVTEYAKNKTINEIAEHFGATRLQIKSLIQYHNIEYKHDKHGPDSVLDEKCVRKVADDMTLVELANFFMVTKQAMYVFCKRRGINYKGKRTNV